MLKNGIKMHKTEHDWENNGRIDNLIKYSIE